MNEQDVFGANDKEFSRALLENGFYPENVPPVFRVKNFFKLASKHIDARMYHSNKPTESATYSASKRGGSRRVFTVPNPTYFVDAAIFFSVFRSEIFEHFSGTTDSISVPEFSATERPARIKSHSDFHKARRYLFATSRYIVKTDISRYFHSIYTHSIPWALNGKLEAKRDRKTESAIVYGNRLDYILRQSQDGQTVGIPVGPDFSRHVSEIIGKSIDKKFRELRGDAPLYLRHVDDIYIGADDIDQATDLLSGVREAIRAFQLDINESKTAIIETRQDLEPFWPVRLRREISNFKGKTAAAEGGQLGSDLVYFLDEVFRVSNAENDDGVVRYVIKKIDGERLWDAYWESVEPFLVRSVVSFPRAWDYVSRIVAWRSIRGENVNKGVWQSVIRKALIRSAKQGEDSEVCWLLWLSKQIESPISEEILRDVILRCGAMSVLLAIDLFQSVPHAYKFPNSLLLDRLGNSPMVGPDWLLAYEADRQFGFKIKTKNIQGNPMFSELYDSDATFYDRNGAPNFVGSEDGAPSDAALEGVYSSYDEEDSELPAGSSKWNGWPDFEKIFSEAHADPQHETKLAAQPEGVEF